MATSLWSGGLYISFKIWGGWTEETSHVGYETFELFLCYSNQFVQCCILIKGMCIKYIHVIQYIIMQCTHVYKLCVWIYYHVFDINFWRHPKMPYDHQKCLLGQSVLGRPKTLMRLASLGVVHILQCNPVCVKPVVFMVCYGMRHKHVTILD